MKRNYFVNFILIILSFISNINLEAQDDGTRILCQSKYIEVRKSIGNGAQRLIDDVVFTHGNAKMYCDSAYYYSKENMFDAFSNVVINQGDTVQVYGKTLHYDGNTKLAEVVGDVKLVNRETTLRTSKLDYDLKNAIGYYTNHADIVNKDNKLNSKIGYYYTREKTIYFRDSVVIINPEYTIYCDTMKYRTDTRTAYFFGPTDIIGDSNHIYCENGWYNTIKDLTELRKNAWVKNKNQTVYSDYIYYNKISGDGTAKDNVKLIDHKQNIILLGNFAKYNDQTEYAFLTDKAQFIQFSGNDSLFLHADTLKTYPDTANKKVLQAFHHVRFYRFDTQGACDSLIYTFADSIGRMYKSPVLWVNENQLSADLIEMYTKNQQMEKMKLYNSSFMVSKQDTNLFNQIKGKNMICYFSLNKLYRVDVQGSSQTVYYPKEGQDIVGVNKSESANMKILIRNNNPVKIMFYSEPKSILYPLDKAPENELRLKGFSWQVDRRPKNKFDIF